MNRNALCWKIDNRHVVHFCGVVTLFLHICRRQSLIPFETAALNGERVTLTDALEYGRGQRKPAKKRSYLSDDDVSDCGLEPNPAKQVLNLTKLFPKMYFSINRSVFFEFFHRYH